MVVLGLILIVLSVLALVAALTGGSNNPATFDLGLFDVRTNTMGVFLLGAATVLVFVAGVAVMRAGVRRASRHRKERKELTRLSERIEADDARRRESGDTPTPGPE
jgi:hypothetical protein